MNEDRDMLMEIGRSLLAVCGIFGALMLGFYWDRIFKKKKH